MSKKSPKDRPKGRKSGKGKPREDEPRKAERLDEASGEDPGPSPERRSTMQPDTPHPEDHPNPQDGAAFIAPVTDAMMDHAAHEAAVLADGVAHGTVTLERAAAEGTEAAGRTASAMSDRADEALTDAAESAVQAGTQAFDGAVRTAEAVAQDAGQAMERGTDAARDALSASADALTQYNAKVMEVMRSNMASTTELFAALIQAKSVPEALSLNADHFRRRMEALTTQGRELATLAQRIAFDAMQPFKRPADR